MITLFFICRWYINLWNWIISNIQSDIVPIFDYGRSICISDPLRSWETTEPAHTTIRRMVEVE